jgi:hypothetical protein
MKSAEMPQSVFKGLTSTLLLPFYPNVLFIYILFIGLVSEAPIEAVSFTIQGTNSIIMYKYF